MTIKNFIVFILVRLIIIILLFLLNNLDYHLFK